MDNLSLIDWRMVAFAVLWVTGLAVVLSAVGFAYYEANSSGEKLRARMGQPIYKRAVNAGLTLFCLGMIGGSDAWWERALWALLAAAFTFYTYQSWRGKN